MKRQTITAVIMTKNVAPFVDGCLKSVTWADEIVVIDGYSDDGTVEICKRYTDKVIQNKWTSGRFCTERNLGTDHATSDWVLQIDPDERATPEFKEAVLTMLADFNNPYSAYEYRKKNYFLGHFMRWGGWFHYSLHLFKRGHARYEGFIHENLKVYGKVAKMEAPVEHYPFTSISQFIQRHNHYADFEAKQIMKERGVLPDRRIVYELTVRPFKHFIKFYFRKHGYRDGIYGFIFSILYSWVRFLNWLKYWELVKFKEKKLEVPAG
jgi:glycosyltransferase involved in cell wall biosynthesis